MPSVAIKPIVLSVIMPNVDMLSIIMLSVIMLSVIMLNVVMLNVVAPLSTRSVKKFDSAASSGLINVCPYLWVLFEKSKQY
jgi:hypothetical protein